MKISSSNTPLAEQNKDVLIIFYQNDECLLPAGNTSLKKSINTYISQSSFKGAAGQTAAFPAPHGVQVKQIIVTGIGDVVDYHNGVLEQATAAAIRTGQAAGLTSFVPYSSCFCSVGRNAC